MHQCHTSPHGAVQQISVSEAQILIAMKYPTFADLRITGRGSAVVTDFNAAVLT